jgi:predicted phosphodiesterase
MRRTAGLWALTAVLLLLHEGTRPAAAQATGEKIVGGPYAVNVGPRSATVVWLAQKGEAALGTEPGKMEKSAPIIRSESITFAGLVPGTTYYYQSFPGDAGKGSFKTPPLGAAKFQFVVYGDTRTRHDVHKTVVEAILKYAAPDFLIHTGDLVAEGADTSLWPIFFNIERELLRKTALFPALGNHEANAKNYFDFLNARSHYSYNWGSAHFSVIDSDIENVPGNAAEKQAFWQEQTRWLETDLRDSQGLDFRFVIAHHPPETAVKRRQGENKQMTELEPIFEKYKVSAGFFGHDHNYQHYLKNGVHYFTTGGGGAPLYDVDTPPANITVKVASTENFVIVNVDGKRAHVEARKPDRSVLDVSELGQ